MFPCFEIIRKKGDEQRHEYFPLECVHILGGKKYTKKAKEQHVADIRKAVSSKPFIRMKNIKERFSRAGHDPDMLKNFGISINYEPMRVEARYIDPPTLVYGRESSLKPRGGTWNFRNETFFDGKGLVKWGIFNFASAKVDRFSHMLSDFMSRKAGQGSDRCQFTISPRDVQGGGGGDRGRDRYEGGDRYGGGGRGGGGGHITLDVVNSVSIIIFFKIGCGPDHIIVKPLISFYMMNRCIRRLRDELAITCS